MSDATFLTKSELTDLIGSKQPAKQRQWLAERGYSFDVRFDGSNVVLRAHVQKKLGGHDVNFKIRKAVPDFKALEELMQHA